LRLKPKDQDARQTKIFLLLQTEQYLEALSLIGDSKQNTFERAYTLYRLQREDDAREILEEMRKQGEDDRRIFHLEAQLVGRFCRSFAISDVWCLVLELSRRSVPRSV